MKKTKWIESIKCKEHKKAMPILTFPAIQKLHCTVEQLVNNSDLQVQAMKVIVDECDPLASLGLMDLSVEAECFGSDIRVHDGEVPTVVGSVIKDMDDAKNMVIPPVGSKRTQIYIDAMIKAKAVIIDRPVFAGVIGPFSLAGRLMDVSEAMIYCYDDPDMVHLVLDKVTTFLIDYCKAYKAGGVDGVVMAEPLAGILSPALASEFSSQYVKRIIDALEDEEFVVIYHNCGNNTIKMVDELLETGASVYHFGNAIDMYDMLQKMPRDKIIMGNIDPVGDIKDGTVEKVTTDTLGLLEKCANYDNFIISTGCDVPPLSPFDNINAFMKASRKYYEK